MLEQIRAHIVRTTPSILCLSIKGLPFIVKKQLIEHVINWHFAQALQDDELSFLDGYWLKVDICDLALSWCVTVRDNKLIVAQHTEADVRFSGNVNDFVLIVARKEDPDTLFFQRRLVIEGNTELGLYVKNLMNSIDITTMPTPLKAGLLQLADFIDSGLKQDMKMTQQGSVVC